jgi:DNA-binding NarL/FixJ family response regulator
MNTTTTKRTSVFLVEDSPAIRVRLAAMLENIAGVTIVGEAETAAAAVEGILRMRPDSVLLDFQLLAGSGLDVLREVHPLEPDTVFIVLTNQPDDRYRKLCLDAGADYFLDKSNEFEKAVELIAGLATRHGPHHIISR